MDELTGHTVSVGNTDVKALELPASVRVAWHSYFELMERIPYRDADKTRGEKMAATRRFNKVLAAIDAAGLDRSNTTAMLCHMSNSFEK